MENDCTRDSFTAESTSGECCSDNSGSETDTIIAAPIVVPPFATWAILSRTRVGVCRLDAIAGSKPYGASGQGVSIVLEMDGERESIPPSSPLRTRVTRGGSGRRGRNMGRYSRE